MALVPIFMVPVGSASTDIEDIDLNILEPIACDLLLPVIVSV